MIACFLLLAITFTTRGDTQRNLDRTAFACFALTDIIRLDIFRNLNWSIVGNFTLRLVGNFSLALIRHLNWTVVSWLGLVSPMLCCLVGFLIAILISLHWFSIADRIAYRLLHLRAKQSLIQALSLLKLDLLWHALRVLWTVLPARAKVNADRFRPNHLLS